jgi:hypothetical protein
MTYTVLPGDTGEKIAAKYTGDKNRWRELLTVNPALKDPTYGIRLYAGKTINLPPAWAASDLAPAPASAPVSAIEEKKGLSTGAMVGLAAGGALVVGGIIYAATRAPRRKGGKARRRARK